MSANSKGRVKSQGSFEITLAFHERISTMAKTQTYVEVRVHKGLFKRDTRCLDKNSFTSGAMTAGICGLVLTVIGMTIARR